MIFGNNNKALFFLALALSSASVEGAGKCCQYCDNGTSSADRICTGFGMADAIFPIDPTPTFGTKEECAAEKYPHYIDENGACVPTGYSGMIGDCHTEDSCTNWTPFASRRPVEWCIANGYTHFDLFYQNLGMCLTTDMAYDKFFGGSPAIEGDPHIKTWAGQWFDYHGECDLVLLDAPKFEESTPLAIHVRTKLRYEYSYIESAAVALGEDVLEVGSFGQWSLNEIGQYDLEGAQISGYPIYHTEISHKQHTFDIVINPVTNITLSTFKDLVAVKLTAAGEDHFGSATGIMGNFKGELVGRDGAIFEDMNEFGQEWQVRADEKSLFRTAREPQAPTQCVLPKTGVAQKRRLGGVTKEAAAAACAGSVNPMNCVADVMASGDLDIALAGAV